MAGNAAFPGRVTASTATDGNCFCLIRSTWLLPSTAQLELSSHLPHPSCGFCGKTDSSVTAAPGWQGRDSWAQVSHSKSPFSAGAIAPVLGKHPLTLTLVGLKSFRETHLHPFGHCLEDYNIYCIHFTSLSVPSPLCLKGLLAKAQWPPTPTQPCLFGLWDWEKQP